MALLAALAVLLAPAGAAAAHRVDAEPLHLFVKPTTGGPDPNAELAGHAALPGLAEAQARLRLALRANPRIDVVVHLLPGTHRVPVGGFRLTEEDSPAAGTTLEWRGEPGATTVSGGEPVTGWAALRDPRLPAGVMVAPAPAQLAAGATARHLFVDGVRASRTRENVSSFNASLVAAAPLPLAGCQWPGLCLNKNKTAYTVPGQLPWSNPMDVELVFSGAGGRGTTTMKDSFLVACWAEPRCTVGSLSAPGGNITTLTMKQPCFYNLAFRDAPITVNRPGTPPPVRKPPSRFVHVHSCAEKLRVGRSGSKTYASTSRRPGNGTSTGPSARSSTCRCQART